MKLQYIKPEAFYKCENCEEKNIKCDGCKNKIAKNEEFLCVHRVEEQEAGDLYKMMTHSQTYVCHYYIHLHDNKECIYKYFKRNAEKMPGFFTKLFR